MILVIRNHSFHYEMENLCRVFFPFEKIKVLRDGEACGDAGQVVTSVSNTDGGSFITVIADIDGSHAQRESFTADTEDSERVMAEALFSVLSEITGYVPPWGILTGVRPSKLMNTLIKELGADGAKAYFRDKLLVSGGKTELAFNVAAAESEIMSLSDESSFSLYVSIPFCPTRCDYCSFVSHSIDKAKKLLPEYVEKLKEEIRLTASAASGLGLRLESIYWGGGTPTTLSAEQLDGICEEIERSFDLSRLREYTIEAGRADTVTREKLEVMRRRGVGRISINPQTFNDRVLETIGRRHTVADVLEAYESARNAGFESVNMDLIAGLTSDTLESFRNTVDTAVGLHPENITLHTLALKRSSRIVTGGVEVESGKITNKMLEYAADKFYEGGYKPYYMYRQSRSLGNLENVGWCAPGKECLYNVFMMEECHTVLAVGAGAVTKLKEPRGRNIERVFNFKYPYEYLSRFGELAGRKKNIAEFYDRYR